MRKLVSVLTALGVLAVASPALAGFTVRYHNDDSSDYEWEVDCANGSSDTVEFDGNKTASVSFGCSEEATVHTPNGDVTVTDGVRLEIEDGTLSTE